MASLPEHVRQSRRGVEHREQFGIFKNVLVPQVRVPCCAVRLIHGALTLGKSPIKPGCAIRKHLFRLINFLDCVVTVARDARRERTKASIAA